MRKYNTYPYGYLLYFRIFSVPVLPKIIGPPRPLWIAKTDAQKFPLVLPKIRQKKWSRGPTEYANFRRQNSHAIQMGRGAKNGNNFGQHRYWENAKMQQIPLEVSVLPYSSFLVYSVRAKRENVTNGNSPLRRSLRKTPRGIRFTLPFLFGLLCPRQRRERDKRNRAVAKNIGENL